MDFETLQREPTRYVYLRHLGPYPQIGATFGEMTPVAREAGLLREPDALFVAVYHDDPMANPPESLRSDAGVTLSDGAAAPSGLEEGTIPGGKHVKGVHKGSYAKMGESWMALYAAMHKTGFHPRATSPFEVYISDMGTTPEDELITEIYVPVE